MAQRGVLRTMGDGLVGFWCPGCAEMHMINTEVTDRPHFPAWEFDGNYEAPTFAPSILVRGGRRLTDDEADRIMAGEKLEIPKRVCHSFVRAGHIQFLGDCTHELAGQTVKLEAMSDVEVCGEDAADSLVGSGCSTLAASDR
jgi:hypothetical protein